MEYSEYQYKVLWILCLEICTVTNVFVSDDKQCMCHSGHPVSAAEHKAPGHPAGQHPQWVQGVHTDLWRSHEGTRSVQLRHHPQCPQLLCQVRHSGSGGFIATCLVVVSCHHHYCSYTFLFYKLRFSFSMVCFFKWMFTPLMHRTVGYELVQLCEGLSFLNMYWWFLELYYIHSELVCIARDSSQLNVLS